MLLLLSWFTGWCLATPAGPAARSLEADLQRLVAELAPLVEEAAGRSFDVLPEVVLADPEDMQRVLYDEQVHLLTHLSHMNEGQASDHASVTASDLSTAFVGKYGFLDKRLYIESTSMFYTLASRGVRADLVYPVLQVVIAHELAHALQDQQADLAAVVTTSRDGDGVMAVNCVVEGHAVWVHEQVGRALGHDEAVDLVAQLLGYVPGEPGLSARPRQFYTSYVYGAGRNFIDYHNTLGGPERIWTIVSAPPPLSSMIVSPDTYQPEGPTADHADRVVLERTLRRLTPRRWRETSEGLGDYELRNQLVNRTFDDSLAEHVIGAWRVRANGQTWRGVEVQHLRFDEPGAARLYVETLRTHAELQLAAMGRAHTPDQRVEEGRVELFLGVHADLAVEEALRLHIGPQEHDLGTVWVVRGQDVLQIMLVNQPVAHRQLARRIDRALDQLVP